MTNNNPVDAIVLGGVDAFLPTRSADKQFLTAVNEKVREAIDAKNVGDLAKIGKSILGINQVTGIAFSEFAYTVEACWGDLKQRDNFFSWAEDNFGKNKVTIERHIRIWEMLISGDVPKEYADKFKTMPVRILIPIANMWHQEYEITDLQWKQLSNCPDPSSVGKKIREIKGKEKKSGSLNIEWHRLDRQIVVWKDGQPNTINLMYSGDPEIIEKALGRLCGDGRALEK